MDLLTNPVRQYAWGSRTAIARLQGRPHPTEAPEAELWIGAHPHAPSRLVADGASVPLTKVIDADPEGTLGRRVIDRFGARLPFLAKVLAAESPLSIQVHPDAEQARAGFAAEQASGLLVDDPKRNYKDPFHKPELLCALTEFEALCGFRSATRAAELMSTLDVEGLAPLIAMLAGPDGLRAACTALLTMHSPRALVDDVARACARGGGPFADDYALTAHVAQLYPGDVGVVFTLLLERLVLAPGEAVFIPAGVPHSYIHGLGVETMASSDNVLRGGLTPKHVDVAELLRIVDFAHAPTVAVRPVEEGDGTVRWPCPAAEFALRRLTPGGGEVRVQVTGPRLVLCTSGVVRLSGARTLELAAGQSVFVPAAEPALSVAGTGEVFVVSTSDDS